MMINNGWHNGGQKKSGHGIRINVGSQSWIENYWIILCFSYISWCSTRIKTASCLLAACILLCFSNRVSGPLWGVCSSLPAIKRGNAKWILFSVKPPSTSIFHYFPMIFPCSQSSMIVASPRPLRGISQPFPGTGGTAQDAPAFCGGSSAFQWPPCTGASKAAPRSAALATLSLQYGLYACLYI